MRMFDIINKKKNGNTLTDYEIGFFVSGSVSGEIPDYQISALLMAICIRGMNTDETVSLTIHMANSGEILNLGELEDLSCDKHSSGGVGDKTTLVVAPIVAACGGIVAKTSGRGLGYTGGTIDKLEALPNFKCDMTREAFLSQAKKIGLSLACQGFSLAPADKVLYAIRDVTATVDSIPLIASSIMSKKIATGAKSIVLDVKCGSGAFMKSVDEAEALAGLMVSIGEKCKKNVRALITDMNDPLGFAVGNLLEVEEAVNILKCKRPYSKELYDVCIALSSHIISASLNIPLDEATNKVQNAVSDGSAYKKFCEWIKIQGGDTSMIEKDEYPRDSEKLEIIAETDGYIESIDASLTGKASVILGAGRVRKNEKIDPLAGILFHTKRSDAIKKGEKIATLYSSSKDKIHEVRPLIKSAVKISEKECKKRQIILKTVYS